MPSSLIEIMKFDQTLLFIFFVTFVTFLLPFNVSLPLTQNTNLYGYSKPRENSISNHEMNYYNRDYPSYANGYDEDYYPAVSSYQTKESRLRQEDNEYTDRSPDEQGRGDDGEEDFKDRKTRAGGGGIVEVSSMVVLVVVALIIIVLVAIGCGVYMICKKGNPETGPGYSVAISNHLMKARGLILCCCSFTKCFPKFITL